MADFDYCWIGTDESGKGDFFGPLVVAGVRVDESLAAHLQEIGVKDSKALTDIKAKTWLDEFGKFVLAISWNWS